MTSGGSGFFSVFLRAASVSLAARIEALCINRSAKNLSSRIVS